MDRVLGDVLGEAASNGMIIDQTINMARSVLKDRRPGRSIRDSDIAAVHGRARQRMIREAIKLGANAIVGMRYNMGTVSTEHAVVAYGTAVVIVPELVPPPSDA